jgi:hypothetical protein
MRLFLRRFPFEENVHVYMILSVQVHLSPPGRGVLSSTIIPHYKRLPECKEWVRHHARTAQGRRLANQSDWDEWLQSPQGQNRPRDIPSAPDEEYSRMAKTYKRKKFWVSWDDFLNDDDDSAGKYLSNMPCHNSVSCDFCVHPLRSYEMVACCCGSSC